MNDIVKQEIHYKERRPYYIYIHTTPIYKRYVGLSRKPIQRWNNGEGYKANKEFYEDIQKFGWDNIKHEVVVKTYYGWLARKIEKMLISKFKKDYMCYNIVNEDKSPCISERKIPLKRVAQYDKDGNLIRIYESASEAGKILRKSPNNIQNCCRGKVKSSAGYIWKYI